jgi:O-antigen/teichoic acid export membrane protein
VTADAGGARGRTAEALRSPLLRQAGIYTISQIASRAIPFLLLPILTRFLAPAEYGMVAMFLLVATFAEPVVGINLPGAVTVKFYDAKARIDSFVGSGFALVGGAAAICLLVVLLLRDALTSVTQVPPIWLLLVIPLVFGRTVGNTLFALLRVSERAVWFAVLQNTLTASILTLAVILVVFANAGWQGRTAAELAAWLAFAALAVVFLRRSGWFSWTFDRRYAAQLIAFGVPLIPHTVGAALMVQTDRLLLTNLVGIEETGLYVVGYQLALVIELLASSFNYAYAPWLFRQLAAPDRRTLGRIVRLTYTQFAVATVVAAAVALVMPWAAAVLLGPRFQGSGAFVAWFAVALLFNAMYYMVANYLFFAERTTRLAAVTIAVALVNIPLTYALIKANGPIGAAQAMAVSYGLTFALTWIASQSVFPMPWVSALRNEDRR